MNGDIYNHFGANAELLRAVDETAERLSAYAGKLRLLDTAVQRKSSYIEAYQAEADDAAAEVRRSLEAVKEVREGQDES